MVGKERCGNLNIDLNKPGVLSRGVNGLWSSIPILATRRGSCGSSLSLGSVQLTAKDFNWKEIDNFDLLFQQSVNKILQEIYFTAMTTSDATTIALTNRQIKHAVGCVPQVLLKWFGNKNEAFK